MSIFIVTSCSYSPGVDRWVECVSRHCGSAIPVVIMFGQSFIVPESVIVYSKNRPFPGMVPRFYPMVKVIEDLGEDNWFVCTDCSDVVMQAPLPDLDQYQTDILVSSEQLCHDEVDFWYEVEHWPDFKSLWKLPIYNAGCFAMKGHKFLDYLFELRSYCDGKDTRKLALDQLILNKWLTTQSFKCVDDLFLNLYATYIRGHRLANGENVRTVTLRNGVFQRAGHIYPIVHGNGMGKRTLDSIVRTGRLKAEPGYTPASHECGQIREGDKLQDFLCRD